MYEQACDIVLQIFEDSRYSRLEGNAHVDIPLIRSEANKQQVSLEIVDIALSILITDGFIEADTSMSPVHWYSITHFGRKFLNTNSYILEGKKRQLDREQNERTVIKMQQDLKLGKWLLKTKWLPFIFTLIGLICSGLSLYISVHQSKPVSYDNKNNIHNNQNSQDSISNNKK